jgi:RND family efflux transporter MFP subunit
MAKANEAVRQAEAGLNTAKTNSIQNMIKEKDYQSSIAARDKARVALTDVEVMAKQKDESEATVQQLNSVLGDAMRNLGETEIRAPVSGVVTKKEIQEGELVASLSSFSSGSPIVTIEDRSQMRVKLQVNEIDVARMAKGMSAKIDIDALPDKQFDGVVAKIAPASQDEQTQSATPVSGDAVVKYEVLINLTKADPGLRSGMSAKCTLEVIKHDNVLELPPDYIGRDGNQRFVSLAPATPKAEPEKRNVTTGAATGAMVEITSGLKEGDKVVKPKYTGPPRKGAMQFGPDDQ